MFSTFIGLLFKTKLGKGVMALGALSIAIFSGYLYLNSLWRNITSLKASNIELSITTGLEKKANNQTKATFNQYKFESDTSLQLLREQTSKLETQYGKARADQAKAEEELTKHDFKKLAEFKPKTLSRLFTADTNKLFSTLNQESGDFSTNKIGGVSSSAEKSNPPAPTLKTESN
jgi:hypothetical protein